MTDEEYAAYLTKHNPAVMPASRVQLGAPYVLPKPVIAEPKMNANEVRYARHLDVLKASGEIVDWQFQPFKLYLAPQTTLTPDFVVIYTDHIAVKDTKGMKRKRSSKGVVTESYWAEEDAMVKIKACAAKFWYYKFSLVWRQSDGKWAEKEIPSN
jgi:hypothetical protein